MVEIIEYIIFLFQFGLPQGLIGVRPLSFYLGK